MSAKKVTRVKLGGIAGANQLEAQFIMHTDGTTSLCFESGAARMFVNTTAKELRALCEAVEDFYVEAAIEVKKATA